VDVRCWIGLPYAELGRGPEAYDCLGLFLAVQKALKGRVLPDPACTMAEAVRRRVVEGQTDWRRIDRDEVSDGDALLFRMAGRPLHIAYALDGRDMLHTDSALGASAIDRWRSVAWASKLVGAYRLVPDV